MSKLNMFRAAVWIAAAILAVIVVRLNGAPTQTAPVIATGEARVGGPFKLTSHKGNAIDNATLVGKPYLVFFGFTNCPDICPTTLFELTDVLAELGPDGDKVTPLFITVDPERDTPELLAAYMTSFDKRILALRGDMVATDGAVKAFAGYYRKVPADGGGYTMDHTAGVIMMDADGRFFGTLDAHEPRKATIAKLRRLIDA